MKKVDVRVKRTYNQLLQALTRLLTEKSFDDLTVLEICEEASVHRATFYKHFVDKYDFLSVCFNLILSELIFDEAEDEYTPETLKKSCMNMLTRVYEFVIENKAIFVSVCCDKCSLAFNTALTDSISKFIVERIQTMPELTAKLGKQIHMLSNYYAGAIVGLVKWWVADEEPCSIEEMLSFSEFKINDLCNYFNMVIS